MKMFSPHPELPHHTWKDVGGPLGLLLDGAFFVLVVIAASLMVAFCTALVLLDHLASPILALMSQLHLGHKA